MGQSPLWIFGYGSLMWNPGFDYSERVLARLPGYARSFCMRSIHHRGTEDDPGLVLALDAHKKAQCHGLAFRVHEAQHDATMAYLRERELISSAYLEKVLDIHLEDGGVTPAVCYVVDTEHRQYCGGLPLAEQAEIIAHAVGGRGPNTEYLYNTADHLAELGIADPDLTWLAENVRRRAG
ncbi:MAG: gamma-glutamylcyclotransferase [Alphaproteobacteria bacterium]|nr:gamma-glutamylcyclotransferase [Alphaproteobacteria bacterium]NNF24091.1 gamma-glutamylcyclotransferase [Paracoccaceae bacterium]